MNANVDTPQGGAVADEVEYVGFWPRVGAALVDTLAVMFLVTPLAVWYFGVGWANAEGATAFVINWILPGVAVVLFWHYKSATPGKMVISAVVVDATTFGRPSASRALKKTPPIPVTRCIASTPCNTARRPQARLRITTVLAILSCQPCLRLSNATQMMPIISGIADT